MAPGWYPDPQLAGQLRWWDGVQWTVHVAPAPWGAPASVAPVQAAPAEPPPGSGRATLVVAAVAAAVLLLAVGLFAVAISTTSTRPAAASRPTTGAPAGTGSPPTTRESLGTRAERGQIPVLDKEGAATHDHALLHVYVDDEPVEVDAHIGIDQRSGEITAVHTHDTTGILHIESPTVNDSYTIGQFLTLWTGGTDATSICGHFTESPCQLSVAVVAPTDADRQTFDGYGRMPTRPDIEASGLDTPLAQGSVIEVRITTGSVHTN